jgi:hypothetical protein
MLDNMKVLILYRPKSEYGTEVETFVHDFNKLHNGQNLELIDVDSVEGSIKSELYDLLEFPTILALDERGSLLQQWTGVPLPLSDEVAYYAQ